MSDGIRIKSSIESLRGLIDEVKAGKLRLPKFQRSFSWTNEQIADLFDSVAKDYPIGSLYVWNTDEDYQTSKVIGPFEQPARRPGAAMQLVIDGQHRLSSFVGVLLAREEDAQQWQLYFDPEDERFCHAKANGMAEQHWVRVRSLTSTIFIINEAKRLMQQDPQRAERWISRLERVTRAITEYEIPLVSYAGDLRSAVDIFARLNQRGKTIGPDELMSALTYREGDESFRLADEIDALGEAAKAFGFGDVPRRAMFRAILSAADRDVYATDWESLASDLRNNPDDLRNAANRVRDGLQPALEFLTGQGIYNVRQLSYGTQLTALMAFFSEWPAPDADSQGILARMLWATSFSAWFKSPALERPLLQELRAAAKTRAPLRALDSFDLETPALPMPTQVDQKSARVRALLNVLVAQSPRREDSIPLPTEELRTILLSRGAAAFAKIFTAGRNPLLQSPANRMFDVRRTPRGAAASWLRQLPMEHRDDVLRSLAIPPESFAALEANDVDAFLEARLSYLDTLERQFMRDRGVTEPKPGAKPAPSPIDSDDD